MKRAALRRIAAAVMLAAAAAAPQRPAHAADDPDDSFRRAELCERGLGDLDRAFQLYRESARSSTTAAARATADIRAASCLRRLGRADEARALLEPWTADRPDVPPDVRRAAAAELAAVASSTPVAPAPDAPRDDAATRLAEKERAAELARQDLERALDEKSKGLQSEIAALAQRLRELDAENARLRAEAAPPAPTTAEEVLDLRKREIERQRQEAQRIAGAFVKTARLLTQEGRFAEARGFLYDALERDSENAEARALLISVSAPLGDRAALFQRALELAALAAEVRAARRAAEVAALTDEARRRQDRGDFAGSSAPLEKALAWIDSKPGALHRAQSLRDDVVRMLQTASARGVPRAPVRAPDADAGEERWTDALRDLLADVGREVEQGLDLRFHDLGVVVASGGLPPVPFGADPTGWSVSTADVDAAPLLAAWLRATEPRALAAPGVSVALVGSTCAVLADLETHRRLAQRLSSLRLGAAPAADVRIAAYRAEHEAIADALAARGVVAAALPGGAFAAALDPADLDALLDAMPRLATGVVGAAALRATPLRAFRLTAGPASAQFVIEMLAVPGARPGIGLRAQVAWAPHGDAAGAALRADALAGAVVASGGGLVVFGVPDPERPGSDTAVVVRVGSAPATGAAPPPPAPVVQAADELRVPASIAFVEDPPAAPLLVPAHPVPSRRDAMLRRLRDAAPRAKLLEMKDDRVLVVGPDDARKAVADTLASYAASGAPALFDVRFHQIAPAAEKRLLDLCPRAARPSSGSFWWVVAGAGRESRDVEYFLRAAQGEIAFRDPVVAAPPTGRVDVARIVRTPFRSGPGVADGGRAWGRGETVWHEEGLVVSLRPFGRRGDGRLDLDLSARARRISDAGRRTAATPMGGIPVHDPATESWWGDLATPLGPGETLVLFGAASPFAGAESAQVAVTVRLAE